MIIVLQGNQEKILVFQKIIVGISDIPMAVTEKDVAGAFRKKMEGFFKGFRKV